MKKIFLLLSLLFATVALAEPNGGCNFTSGSPGCVAFDGNNLNLATEGDEDIKFLTNGTLRGYIDGTTGALTGFALASPTFTTSLLGSPAAASELFIGTTSVDGADSNVMRLCSTSACSGTRGGYFEVNGNETSGGFAGVARVVSGDNSPIKLYPRNAGTNIFTFDSPSSTSHTLKFGNGGTTAVQQFTISGSTSDADDDSSLILTGGGAAAGTRGGVVTIAGDQVSGGGDISLTAGSTSGSDVLLSTSATSSIVRLNPQQTTDYFSFGSTSDTIANMKFGDGGTTAAQTLNITASTADADDDSIVCISGGGACGSEGRGAWIQLTGRDSSSGYVQVASGDAAGALLVFDIKHASANFRIRDSGFGTLWNITGAGDVTQVGALTSSRTTDLGWAVVDGSDDTACTSQCTSAAVFGLNLAAGATAPVMVGPSDATADICLCAGAS